MMIEDVLEMRPSIPSTQNNTPSHQNSYSFSTLTIITGKGRKFYQGLYLARGIFQYIFIELLSPGTLMKIYHNQLSEF